MEKQIEIIEYEDKKTEGGISYARFKTNLGWISCFNLKEVEKLKKLLGKTATVEIQEAGNFKNIKKVIEEKKESEDKIEVIKHGDLNDKADEKYKAMYVSYAKDIFCALMLQGERRADVIREVLDISINAVKNLKTEL